MAKQDTKEQRLFSIEELKVKKEIKETVYQGVKVSEGWSTGKMVTEDEFLAAVKKFLKSPLKGKEAKKDVEGREDNNN